MPGIITHNKIFVETVKQLSLQRKKSYLLRSLESLFSSPEFRSAALFGAIGPNIFDYVPHRKKNCYTGQLAFALHNGGCSKLIVNMIDKIKGYSDYNTNWSSTQRAYLYGFISHMVTDAYFHPYVFYRSGYSHQPDLKMQRYYREQNLLFQYSIDNYFMYYAESSEDYGFSCIENMFPVKNKKGRFKFNRPIKALLLQSLHDVFPDMYNKVVIVKSTNSDVDYSKVLSWLDFIPFFIKKTYQIKLTGNSRLKKMFIKLNNNALLHNDFFVCYPDKKHFNKEILNIHRSRWEYPTKKTGYHYDSIDNLIAKTTEITMNVWENIESVLYGKSKNNTYNELLVNMYTGDGKYIYEDMELSDPIKIQY